MVVDAHGLATEGTESETQREGLKIETNFRINVTKITKYPVSGATKAYIHDGDNITELASASFVGDDATFSFVMSGSTPYYVTADNDGSSFTSQYSVQEAGFPLADTNINWLFGIENADRAREIVSVTSFVQADVTPAPSAIALSLTSGTPTINILMNPSVQALALTLGNSVGFVMRDFGSTITIGTGTIGTRFLDRNYPYEEGLIAGTTKQVGNPSLKPEVNLTPEKYR